MPRSLADFSLILLLNVACSASGEGAEQTSTSGGQGGEPGVKQGAAGGSSTSEREVPEPAPATPSYPELSCPEDTRGFAREVIDFTAGSGQDFGQADLPDIVLGGPQGGGVSSGSLDVASLGDGGSIELGFGELAIVDGPGKDFIVFENAFADQSGTVFTELARVEVSEQGSSWVAFPCDEETGAGCAGVSPVLAHPSAGLDVAFDPQRSGGDAYDLADIGLSRARFVRVVDLAGDDAVFDLDAVSVVHGECEPG